MCNKPNLTKSSILLKILKAVRHCLQKLTLFIYHSLKRCKGYSEKSNWQSHSIVFSGSKRRNPYNGQRRSPSHVLDAHPACTRGITTPGRGGRRSPGRNTSTLLRSDTNWAPDQFLLLLKRDMTNINPAWDGRCFSRTPNCILVPKGS